MRQLIEKEKVEKEFTPEERENLKKLFELFIAIDERIKNEDKQKK